MNLMQQWHDASMALLPDGIAIYDAHTHTGVNDPDGVTSSIEGLARKLHGSGQAGAVFMTSQDPDGYPQANDRILAEARGTEAVEMIPFLRVDPHEGAAALREIERSLDAGARGIKVHPRAERFSLHHPTLTDIARLASERSVPILTHAGRGIPSLGEDALRLCDDIDGLRLILAHAAISDLSWIAIRMGDVAGLYIDTSWWDLTDLLALMEWAPPSRILYASDTPYGHPSLGMILTARAAAATGYGDREMTELFGGNLHRVLAAGPEVDDRPPDHRSDPPDPALVRVHALLRGAIVLAFARADTSEQIDLARLSCRVPDSSPAAEVLAAVAAILDDIDFSSEYRSAIIRPLLVAAAAALTPAVPVP